MFFILKLIINMELIDTPNPNAKKVLAKNISSTNFHNENTQLSISKQLQNIEHMSSIITENEQSEFEIIDIKINEDLLIKLPNKLTLDTYEDYQKLTKLIENKFDLKMNLIIKKIKFTNLI